MSVELSHRLAWARPFLARELPWPDRYALWLACERAARFADLSEQQQRLILKAEAARERAIAGRQAAVGQ
jgi:hypothetical protein